MSAERDRNAERPLVITGMHRSGTSLLASMLATAGIHVGDDLLGPRTGNSLGHFEDVGFLDFHIRALRAVGDNPDGYSARAVTALPPKLTAEADGLVAARAAAARPWGWKDPRTTLFLDFWQERLPDARYVFVFRSPWDVADSLFRRGDSLFVEHTAWALHAWLAYNRIVLDFVARHADRCLVVDIAAVIEDASRDFKRIRTTLDVPVGDPAPCYRPGLFARERNPLGKSITAALLPEAMDVFRNMQRLAGSAVSSDDAREGLVPIADPGAMIGAWARASRAEALATRESVEAEAARSELARTRAELEHARAELEHARSELERQNNELEQQRGELERQRGELEQARAKLESAHAEIAVGADRLDEATAELSSVAALVAQLREEAAATAAYRRRLQGEILAAMALLPPGSDVVANRILDLVFEVVERPGGALPIRGPADPVPTPRRAA